MTQQATEQEQVQMRELADVFGCSEMSAAELIAAFNRGITEKEAEKVMTRVANLQAEVDRRIAILALELGPTMRSIQLIQDITGPAMRKWGVEECKKAGRKSDNTWKKKNVRLGGGGVFFVKQGGLQIADSTELRTHLLNNPRKLHEMGIEITISLDSKTRAKILNHCKETGEKLPGTKFEPVDDFAKMNWGGTKAWSTKSASTTISAALGRSMSNHLDEMEDGDE